MSYLNKYELVIGLEVHAQLSTQSKLFCGDATSFGAEPNTQVSAITLGYPGTLPKTNNKAVEYAVIMGLACGCNIEKNSFFARKNYFYADLPKGFQISQHTAPICTGGFVPIRSSDGEKTIQLNRIHLEEDAGKSIHDLEEGWTCIDLNRAGTPLIEIVTEPCIHSAEDAYQYLVEVRKLVRWLNICDGNMEEGSLRCDANISLRKKGTSTLGTKVEVKNLNSMRHVKKAIEFEAERLANELNSGNRIIQQTRSYDAATNTTFAIRDKEEANDYRYFPDPDLPMVVLTNELIQSIQAAMPTLPKELFYRFQEAYSLGEYDAAQLTEERAVANYFIELTTYSKHFKSAANWMLGPVRQHLNETQTTIEQFPIGSSVLAALIELVEIGKLSFSAASTKVFSELLKGSNDPLSIAQEMGLFQVSDNDALEIWVNEALAAMPEKVIEYKKGKKGLIGLFVGEVKKRSKGTADPKLVTRILEQKLA